MMRPFWYRSRQRQKKDARNLQALRPNIDWAQKAIFPNTYIREATLDNSIDVTLSHNYANFF